MVDRLQSVCCMCGDVGFPDKLFRCNKCRNRFQHSYGFRIAATTIVNTRSQLNCAIGAEVKRRAQQGTAAAVLRRNRQLLREARAGRNIPGTRSSNTIIINNVIKRWVVVERRRPRVRNHGSPVPSPRTATRRYKLLKDVMC
ncbi:hypothetical protein M0R45_034852 [Rubus argutus]|uniref:PHD-type zinc finger plants domain-containing protein n=1 Tax=Rubus argutus TaxID=59490 RepID=A0AAW1VRF8_RUBAR